jgi:hypothetical protein
MNTKTYSTDSLNPFLGTSLSQHGWRASDNSLINISTSPREDFNGWQIVTESNIERDNIVVVPELSLDYVLNILNAIEKSISNLNIDVLMNNEHLLFDSLFEYRITSYDEFPLSEILGFLSNWGDIFDFSEQEKVSYFLLSTLDVEVEVKTFSEFTKIENTNMYSNVLRAHSNNSDLFYCFKDEVEIDSGFKIIFTLLLIYQDQKLEKETFESYSKGDWDIILNSLTHPTCLVSQDGELILHNSSFSSLGLFATDCLKVENGKTIESNDQVYKVLREKIRVSGKDYDSFVFFTDTNILKEGNLTISSEELGIISGSIAHELNNPIAGILAAITLLKLEDDLDEDSLQVLDDMEKGAKRCQKLIEVFLSFSRIDPSLEQCESLESSLEQSLSLMRSRMVESNLKMKIDYEVSSAFSRPLNNSIASMIFYLILSEGFTLAHHQKLVVSNLNEIFVSVVERHNELAFTFSTEIKLFDQLQNSKLFLHLLNILSIDLEGSEGHVRLRQYDS